MEIKKVDPLSVGKVFAFMYGVLASFLAIIFLVVSVIALITTQELAMLGMLVIAIAAPILYTALAFVIGILLGYMYNFTTKYVGGIKIQNK